MRFLLFLNIVSLTLFFVSGCSPHKTNLVAVTYHNTTAHYNAYFIANQTVQEIEKSLEASQQRDYNHILKVIPPLDSMTSVTYADQIDKVYKKASLIIQNHPNSKWVDDGYNLVGLARLYGYEYTHAIETFKWVNTNSKNDDTRHEALINLMRTFIEFEEMNNAIAVSDYLEKEDLNSENVKKLNLMRALYYQNMEDWDNMVRYLVLAVDDLDVRDDKAMVYFIIGQLYQQQGFDAEAFSNYKKCLGSSPEYELSFYARLNMARVSNLESTRDIKNIRKEFKKLVKDAKNKEFVDRIYYEWGSFELRQNNLNEGIEKFNLSVQTDLNNPLQKGRSYLMLGQIYYDTLKNYNLAKAYYDSTIQVLPRDYEDYESIKSRQEVLDEFITQLEIVQLQDSLLALASMDSLRIAEIINAEIKKEAMAQEEALEKEKKRSSSNQSNSSSIFESTGISSSAGSWYFSNPASVALGQSDFRRIWGNRPLEDNWRRSIKTLQTFEVSETEPGEDEADPQATVVVESPEEKAAAEYNSMYATIPFQPDEQQQALNKIEDAMFKLGNIYYFDLRELDNAINTFESYLDRFDPSVHSPEVLFKLYLLCNNIGQTETAEALKNRLINTYPETTFAKELINPDYQIESQQANEILIAEYQKAYRYYEKGNFNAADSIAQRSIATYPDGDFVPRIRLLQIMIVGKTKDLFEYQLQLGEFIETHPDDEITPFAKELLVASDRYKEGLIKLKDADFAISEESEHYFFAIYAQPQSGSDKLITQIEDFNIRNFQNAGLKTGTLKLDDSRGIVLVDNFSDQQSALFYYDLWKANNTMAKENPTFKFDTFVISKSNFEVLYKTKEIDTYKSFYSRYY